MRTTDGSGDFDTSSTAGMRARARRRLLAVPALLLALLGLLVWSAVDPSGRSPQADASLEAAPAGTAEIRRADGETPLRFEQNRGQTDPRVRFLVRAPGHTLFLTRSEAVLSLAPAGARSGRRAVVRMRLVGANRSSEPEGSGRLAGTSNYYRGGDRRTWRSGVPSFGRVKYRAVYPGVDLIYRSRRGRLEYDFVVAPGADPRRIEVGFAGTRRLRLTAEGDLELDARGGTLRQHKPFVYQRAGGARRRVTGRFVLRGADRVGFELGRYDRTRPLVIDPEVSYATYIGGSKQDWGKAIAIDGTGSAYVTGVTDSVDFPRRGARVNIENAGGKADAFVTKLTPDGSDVAYSTYLGGSGAEGGGNFGQERAGIAVDSSGSAYVTGQTESSDFPTTEGAYMKEHPASGFAWGFAAKLDSVTGKLLGSTYLTAPGNGVAVDPAGAVYVLSGGTKKLKADLSGLHYETTLAFGNAIAVDDFGHAYVAGEEKAHKLNQTGNARVYSVDLGGTARGIVVDGAGAAYVTGEADATFEATPDAYQTEKCASPDEAGRRCPDAFVTKINPSTGSGEATISYSTYLGGNRGDSGSAIGVDSTGRAYVTGYTASDDFPTRGAGPFGGGDVYLARLDAGGKLADFTYLGGSGEELPGGLAVDRFGNAYVTGQTESDDFTWTEPLSARSAGGAEAFVARIAPADAAVSVLQLKPRGGPTSGGTEVTISGKGLSDATAVRFGEEPASFTVDRSRGEIVAVAPAHAEEGLVPVRVTTSRGATSARTYLSAFHYGEGAWRQTDHLATARFGHTAVLLDGTACDARPPPGWCGKVLIAGGNTKRGDDDLYDMTKAVELFDPRTGRSSAETCSPAETPSASCPESLGSKRALHSATPLPDGKVLVVGGYTSSGGVTKSAELYDPSSGSWQAAASLPPPTEPVEEGTGENLGLGLLGHTASFVPDGPAEKCGVGCGKVLVAGGADGLQPYQDGVNTVFAYDVADDEWTPAGPLLFGRFFHTALQVGPQSCGAACGQVLLIGGYDAGGRHNHGDNISPPELYDPFKTTSLPRADWEIDRVHNTAHLLKDGDVLVVGGNTDYVNGNSNHLVTGAAEVYDTASDSWHATQQLRTARFGHAGALLPSGKVLVAGGSGAGPLASAELYDPALRNGGGGWRSAGSMLVPRTGVRPFDSHTILAALDPTATLLSGSADVFDADPSKCGENCGKVLVVGGSSESFAELYTPEPTVTRIAPTTGAAGGGTRVTINGTGFTHDVREVRFGNAVVSCPSASCEIESYSELKVEAPASATNAGVPVTVVNEGGAAQAAERFSYTGATDGASGSRPRGEGDSRIAPGSGGAQIERRGDDAAGRVIGTERARAIALRRCLSRAARPGRRPRRRGRGRSTLPGDERRRCRERHGRTPGRVTAVRARGASKTKIVLSFRAPGTNGRRPPAARTYLVKQSRRPIRSGRAFRRARTLCNGSCRFGVARVGARLTLTITGLRPRTTYYYAIAARDNVSRRLGPRSRAAHARTR